VVSHCIRIADQKARQFSEPGIRNRRAGQHASGSDARTRGRDRDPAILDFLSKGFGQ
jgi:hypothetical protein